MLKLFKFEFRKLFQSKAFYTCIIALLLYVLIPIIVNKINDVSFSRYLLLKESIPAILFPIIIGVFIAIYVTEDDESGAIKNIYSKGYNRTKVFITKYVVSLCGVLLMILITSIISYLIGFMFWKNDLSYKDTWLDIYLKKTVLVIAFHSVFYAITSFFSKLTASIIVNILGPFIVLVVLNLIDSIVNSNIKGEGLYLSKYELTNLLLLPSTDSVNIYLVCVIYIAVSIVIGYILNRRKEV